MKENADNQLAGRIIDRLKEANLFQPEELKHIKSGYLSQPLTVEDWKMQIENAIERENKDE